MLPYVFSPIKFQSELKLKHDYCIAGVKLDAISVFLNKLHFDCKQNTLLPLIYIILSLIHIIMSDLLHFVSNFNWNSQNKH